MELLPLPLRLFNAAAAPLAPRLLRLDADHLMRRAQRSADLEDFGDRAFEEPLRVLVRALEDEAGLHAFGRFAHRSQLEGLLVTRLRVQDLLRRHPEILEERIERPIVILGLPRTGTTLLQRLLSRDPGLRSLPYWESMSPLPEGDAAVGDGGAARIRRAEQSLRFLYWCAPRMRAMHELDAHEADEEIWLLAIDFVTMLHEAMAYVPSYRDWYLRTDVTPTYRHLRRMLQILQRYWRGERWLLKSPQHLEQLGPLLAVYPDATVVQTHRDPVHVTASFCSMVTYGARMNAARPDPLRLGRYWADRIETLLRRSADDRPAAHARQFVDVRFADLMRDPIASVRRIYEVADRDLTPVAEENMRAYLAANPRGKHGEHTYRLEDFGLETEERASTLHWYRERFDV